MPEMIDRLSLIDKLDKGQKIALDAKDFMSFYALVLFKVMLQNEPEIEPEVRHGRWIEMAYHPVGDTMYCDCNCSSCNFQITSGKGQYPRFCENCGAKMDGGTDNG